MMLQKTTFGYWEYLLLLGILLTACDDGGATEEAIYPVPFRAEGDYLAVWEDGTYHPIFLKGMNLGVGVPGTQPGELAITEDQYERWLVRMGEMGINALRIYTLHYPRFYEAFRAYNRAHRDAPIYLLQGIWLDEDNPNAYGDLYGLSDTFDEGIEEVIDCVHGNRTIPERYGRAFGTYTDDVSQWVIGWLIGREIIPFEVVVTNELHPDDTAFQGAALALTEGTPAETWATARLDKVIVYESEAYGFQRPVSLSSWPTLDPLDHPTEGPESGEDSVSIDLANVALIDAPGGLFYSFHAYPYYPDFMNDDPSYAEFSDDEGVNNYVGYLSALKTHYNDRPLLIAEFGVPSSWGNAHDSVSGMDHGGHDEQAQGRYDARQLLNIYDTGCGGGALFAWMDEWWKRTWITDDLDMPRSSFPRWWNVTAAEQNFGMIAFEPSGPEYTTVFSSSSLSVRQVSTAATNPFFYVEIKLDTAVTAGDSLTIGFDTYRADLGESQLPDGTKTDLRAELALTIIAPDAAELHVTEAYDLFGIWHDNSSDAQLYHSTVSDGAPWMPVRWQNNGERLDDSGEILTQASVQPIGVLRVSENTQFDSSLDAIRIDGATIEIRIPWTLLQFTDPTAAAVMDDNRDTPEFETTTSDGIALTVISGDQSVETDRYLWQGWEMAPETEEREKESLEIFAETVQSLPSFI